MKISDDNSVSNEDLIPVILSGGSGTRLWPLSRETYPKQYINLSEQNNLSLLQNTCLRLRGLNKLKNPIVITNQSGIHRGLLSWQEYEAVTYKMLDLLENNAHISAIYANACSPNSEDSWRKPNTGMINEAAKDFNIDIKKSQVRY